MSRRLPKDEYERGWNHCFEAVIAVATLRPEIVRTSDRFYDAVCKLARESGVEILNQGEPEQISDVAERLELNHSQATHGDPTLAPER